MIGLIGNVSNAWINSFCIWYAGIEASGNGSNHNLTASNKLLSKIGMAKSALPKYRSLLSIISIFQ